MGDPLNFASSKMRLKKFDEKPTFLGLALNGLRLLVKSKPL